MYLMMDLALAMEGSGSRAEEPAGLLRRAKDGDLAAFEQLLILHERLVFLTALRILGRPEDAQDATQEVFLRLHKHLGGFDEIRDFRPWLYRVTVNVCRDVHRKRQRTDALSLDDLPEITAASPDPQAAAALEEQRRMVALALEHLPQKERAAIVLRDIEGLSTKEVARIIGSREGTVRVQIASARLKIKKLIGSKKRLL